MVAKAGTVQHHALQEPPYFEHQEEAWCGMHALNNLLGGPYVTKSDCRAAADIVVVGLGLPMAATRPTLQP